LCDSSPTGRRRRRRRRRRGRGRRRRGRRRRTICIFSQSTTLYRCIYTCAKPCFSGRWDHAQ